jgi:lysozyme
MDHKKLKKLLIEHEGIKYAPYKCTAGKTTIGIGHNLDEKGVSKAVVNLMYEEDAAEVEADLRVIFNDFDTLPDPIQLVLADMRFQLGYGGFRSFKRMILAVKGRNLPGMIVQMKNSDWHSQTPRRVNDLISMVLEVA